MPKAPDGFDLTLTILRRTPWAYWCTACDFTFRAGPDGVTPEDERVAAEHWAHAHPEPATEYHPSDHDHARRTGRRLR